MFFKISQSIIVIRIMCYLSVVDVVDNLKSFVGCGKL